MKRTYTFITKDVTLLSLRKFVPAKAWWSFIHSFFFFQISKMKEFFYYALFKINKGFSLWKIMSIIRYCLSEDILNSSIFRFNCEFKLESHGHNCYKSWREVLLKKIIRKVDVFFQKKFRSIAILLLYPMEYLFHWNLPSILVIILIIVFVIVDLIPFQS